MDALRIGLLFVGIVLAMLCVKVAWQAFRSGRSIRGWLLAGCALLLLTPMVRLLDFDRAVSRVTVVFYGAALVCGLVVALKVFTVKSPRGKARDAAERRVETASTAERRVQEDSLRADDRLSQEGERADSRRMYDEAHLDESTATADYRADMRELQDDNREHSHGLQDSERASYRADEDRAS